MRAIPVESGRNDRAHGDEGLTDFEPFMESALESVVETILFFGEYPQPRRVGTFITTGSRRPKQFDLYEFLEDKIELCELLEFFICSLNDQTNYGAFSDLRSRWEKRIEKMLVEHLTGHAIVMDKALEMALEEQNT